MFGKQCCCETGQSGSEREQLVSAPTDIGDFFLGSALGFENLEQATGARKQGSKLTPSC